MIKIFKIIEKVVYVITALAIVAVLGMLLIGVVASVEADISVLRNKVGKQE